MPITLLLDLDDTLLDSNMDAFIPAYFQALSAALAGRVAPEIMLPALVSGTRRMMANEDPAFTLREIFDASFFPKLGVERSSLQASIDQFYDDTFPSLSYLTKPRPAAVRLVEWAFARGDRLAIATNPLFPLKAIEHRLRWAGLSPDKYPFALVSSYETFHFTKETTAYYPEVMGQLGWPEDPVIMVGDDIGRDVEPSLKAGFPIYWIRLADDLSPDYPGLPQGRLESFSAWLEKADTKSLQPAFKTPVSLLAVLRSTPAALATLTHNLPVENWLCQLDPAEWCLTEIICHLRDVERDVNLPRLRKILAEENPFIPGEVTDRWVEERQYAKQNGIAALAEFTVARKDTLALLSGLETEWGRTARHAIFGPTSLQELVRFMAEHDQAHIRQVVKTTS